MATARSHSKSSTLLFNSFNLHSWLLWHQNVYIFFFYTASFRNSFTSFAYCPSECTFLCLPSNENKIIHLGNNIFVHMPMRWFEIFPFIYILYLHTVVVAFTWWINIVMNCGIHVEQKILIIYFYFFSLIENIEYFHYIYKWITFLFTFFILILVPLFIHPSFTPCKSYRFMRWYM